MHCLSNWNTFPVYQSGKTDVVETINWYSVSKNNWNGRMLCIKEQVDCKIKGRLQLLWPIQLSLSIISHFTAVPTLWYYSLLSALWISALLYQPGVYILLVYNTFSCAKNRAGGWCDSHPHTWTEQVRVMQQLLQLFIGPVHTHQRTFQSICSLGVQP